MESIYSYLENAYRNIWLKYIWIIVGIIALTMIIKVILLICKAKAEEQSLRQQIPAPRRVSTSSANIREFGPVNYFANTRHNQKDKWFQFMYREVNGEWLAYILRMPSLNGRDGNLHYTHRYKNKNTYWVCFDPQPNNLKDCQSISKMWADCELEYITTGVKFEDQVW